MAKNKPFGDGHRIGAVKERSQTINPKNNRCAYLGPDLISSDFYAQNLKLWSAAPRGAHVDRGRPIKFTLTPVGTRGHYGGYENVGTATLFRTVQQ